MLFIPKAATKSKILHYHKLKIIKLLFWWCACRLCSLMHYLLVAFHWNSCIFYAIHKVWVRDFELFCKVNSFSLSEIVSCNFNLNVFCINQQLLQRMLKNLTLLKCGQKIMYTFTIGSYSKIIHFWRPHFIWRKTSALHFKSFLQKSFVEEIKHLLKFTYLV